jgi:hypothetical protein
MDQKLTFSDHTKQTVIKTKRSIGALCKWLRKWASTRVLNTAIQSISLPIMMYAIEVWYPPDLNNQKNVEKAQKFAARLITNNFKQETYYTDLLENVKWKPIYRLVAERRLMLIKKCMDGTRYAPEELFPLQQDCENRRSRRLAESAHPTHSLMLSTNRQTNTKESKMAACKMVTLWNSLDETVIKLRMKAYQKYVGSDEAFNMFCSRGAIVMLSDF